jgi:5-methyltetrahydrofolate--homocysteine methyltransferase
MATFEELALAVQEGNAAKTRELTSALLGGANPEDILNRGLLAGMEVVGRRFKANEVFIPEVLTAARAMNGGMEILKPQLVKSGVKPVGKMIIGTVKGDLHDIGKNLVKMMAQGSGIEVVDLGIDVPADKFLDGLERHPDARVLGMSALLTTTMIAMGDVIERVKRKGVRDTIKIVVGGAPLTEQFAREIGADGYSPDAASAAEMIRAMMEGE